MSTRFLQEILNRLKDAHNQRQLHKDGVLAIMSLFRQHLETLNLETFPTLFFYCNWMLHKDLHKGIVQDHLRQVSAVLVDGNAGHPADKISEILSLAGLRSEIRIILKEAGFESGIFDTHDDWKSFASLMFPFLIEKPLKWKGVPTETPYVESLELRDRGGNVFWHIKIRPMGSSFEGPLLLTERPEDFVYTPDISNQ